MSASEWPVHENKEWQAVLDRARELGWPTPAWTSNHPKIKLSCPDGTCKVSIFSTGEGTERVAIQWLRKVNRCPHRNVTSEMVRVDEHLDVAERLVRGAETLLHRGLVSERIDELLTLAELALASAGDAISTEFDNAVTLLDLDDEKLAELGQSKENSVIELADESAQSLRKAKRVLDGLPKRNDDALSRRERHDALSRRREQAIETARTGGG